MNAKDLIRFQLEVATLKYRTNKSWKALLRKYASCIKTEVDAIEVSIEKWRMIVSLSTGHCGYCTLYSECAQCPVQAECEEVLNMIPRDVIKRLREMKKEKQ